MSQKSYNNTATLYLIPTPIGNFEDITIRSIDMLKKVDVIFSEDTRVTKNLLNKYDINNKLIALHEHNEKLISEKALNFLSNGKNIALVTDRGTPIISDPGYETVRKAIIKGYNVVSLPGPTALIPALTSSGLPPLPFIFYGFLNSNKSKKEKEIEELKNIKYTMIFYETPHRIINTLEMMGKILGNRAISISREISKKFEEIYRGSINEVINELIKIKGEIVIVVEGNKNNDEYENLSIIEHINLYIKEGFSEMNAIKKVAKDKKIAKSDIYKEYHKK